jgi:hypothetical protein
VLQREYGSLVGLVKKAFDAEGKAAQEAAQEAAQAEADRTGNITSSDDFR